MIIRFLTSTFAYTSLLLFVLVCALTSVGQQVPTSPDSTTTDKKLAQTDYDMGLRLLNQRTQESVKIARDLFGRSAEKFRQIGDVDSEALSLFYFAVATERLGNDDDAYAAYSLALPVLEKSSQRGGEAVTLNNLGLIHARRGEHDAAKKVYIRSIDVARIAKDLQKEARTRSNLAVLFERTGEIELALENYREAARLFATLKDLSALAKTYNAIGLVFADSRDPSQGRDYFTRAIEVAEGSGDSSLQGKAQYNIAQTFFAQDRPKEALEYLRRSATSFSISGPSNLERQVLYELGLVLNTLGQFRESIESLSTALSIELQEEDLSQTALIQASLGIAYAKIAESGKAIGHLEAALPILRKLPLSISNIWAIESLALLKKDKGNPQAAFALLEEALTGYRALSDKYGEAHALAQMGILYIEWGSLEKAAENYRLAAELYRSLNEIGKETEINVGLAQILSTNGDHLEARELLEKSLRHFLNVGDNVGAASTRSQLALSHLHFVEFNEAIELSELALEYFKNQEEKWGYITVSGNLGYIYAHLGKFDRAREYFELSLAEATKANRAAQIAGANMGLGFLHLSQEEFDKAIPYFSKALAFYRSYGAKSPEAIILNNLGYARLRLKQFELAEKDLEAARAIFSDLGDGSGRELAYINLGDLYVETNRLEKAYDSLTTGLLIAQRSGSARSLAHALASLGEFWLKNRNKRLAVFYGKQAVNAIQSVRKLNVVLDVELQRAYVSQFEEGYRKLANVLIELGRIPEAEQVLAMLKEEEFFGYLRRDGDVSSELLARIALTPEERRAYDEYLKYSDQLTELGKELGELQIESRQYEIGKFPKQTRLDELEKLLQQANQVFLTFLDQLKLQFGERDVRVNVLESGTQALLKELNEPGTVFISTVLSDTRLNIILTTAEIQKAYAVNVENVELNRLVSEFRSALRNPRIDPRPAGKAIFDLLFPADLRKDLKAVDATTLVWSLDGTLRYVPISALWDGEKYLVESLNNVVITLASRDKLRSNVSERAGWTALGVGVSRETTIAESDGTIKNFEALPAVPEELCRVIHDPNAKDRCLEISGANPGVITGRTLLDDDFTVSRFRDSVSRFPVVHIASHFSLNAGNENDSYLLLGGGDDRRLTLAAIRQGGARFTGVELLTLSACDTAMTGGHRANGLEIEGFGALAQRSGARTVLASLWAVADSSTRDLMTEFYRQLSATKSVGKAEALRRAQLTLLSGEYEQGEVPGWRTKSADQSSTQTSTKTFLRDPKAPFAHPYYWSPFILIGNWK